MSDYDSPPTGFMTWSQEERDQWLGERDRWFEQRQRDTTPIVTGTEVILIAPASSVREPVSPFRLTRRAARGLALQILAVLGEKR